MGESSLVPISELKTLAAMVEPGMRVALPVDYAGVAMALTPHLIAQGAGDLHLVCVPTGGLQPDMLIGAGLVRTIETSAMTLGEAGGAPCFNRAVRNGSIEIRDATCPAIHAGLLAAQKGAPFTAMRGLIGTDVLRHRLDWRVIDNPFADGGDPVVLIPAIQPDVAIFHCPMADRAGNVWIGRRRELAAMAYASKRTIVTVERVIEGSLFENETVAAGTLPALYVDAIGVAPKGAWPYGLWSEYPADSAEILRYAAAAKTEEGFATYLADTSTEAQAR